MADKHDKEKDDKPKDDVAPKSAHSSKKTLLEAIVWDIIIMQGLPWGFKLFQMVMNHKAEQNTKEVPKHLKSFEEALVILKGRDEHAYDKIDDLLKNGLSMQERHQFKKEAGKLGGEDPALTVGFLLLVAAEPDIKAMREFLVATEFIGAGSPNQGQKLIYGRKLWKAMKKNASELNLNWLEATEGVLAFETMLAEDTQRQKDILTQLEKRLLESKGEVSTSFLSDLVDWWRRRRELRRQLWSKRWERFTEWRRERREYRLRRLIQKEETKRVQAVQPKRRWFFTLFHFRSR